MNEKTTFPIVYVTIKQKVSFTFYNNFSKYQNSNLRDEISLTSIADNDVLLFTYNKLVIVSRNTISLKLHHFVLCEIIECYIKY